jgi:putative FmdB family regulatory protein
MPIYEYVCQDCHQRYERLVLRANGEVSCPHCGSRRATLQFSVFATPQAKSAAEAAPSCGCTPSGCGCN